MRTSSVAYCRFAFHEEYNFMPHYTYCSQIGKFLEGEDTEIMEEVESNLKTSSVAYYRLVSKDTKLILCIILLTIERKGILLKVEKLKSWRVSSPL